MSDSNSPNEHTEKSQDSGGLEEPFGMTESEVGELGLDDYMSGRTAE